MQKGAVHAIISTLISRLSQIFQLLQCLMPEMRRRRDDAVHILICHGDSLMPLTQSIHHFDCPFRNADDDRRHSPL